MIKMIVKDLIMCNILYNNISKTILQVYMRIKSYIKTEVKCMLIAMY